MKKLGIIATICCAFALCFALMGCGGGDSASGDSAGDAEAAKAAFAGTWDLVGMVQDGTETSQSDLEMLSSLGLDVYLDLNDDGTAALVLFGESMAGSWEATSVTSGTLSLDGSDPVEMVIDGENLKMTENESSLTFAKGEPRSAAATSSTSTTTADDSDSDDGSDDDSDEESEE